MTEKFLEQIDAYLAKHREELKRPRATTIVCYCRMSLPSKLEKRYKKIERILEKSNRIYRASSMSDLDELLRHIKQTFPQYLLNFIAEHGMSEVEVYQRAHLDRRTFSKFRNVKDYMPSKNTVLLIALAMELSLDEAEKLLHEGGYHLSERSKKDTIIKFFFENQIYDLFLLDETLDHYGFKPLCS